ncbi:MAG: hypothetical protein IJ019_00190 [Alphaproteobacteria bacterium]|nr:hypothetical protein [Alphaproteobacteria bacterium]
MRQYFLLTAAALIISGTANATDQATGTLQASVAVIKTDKIECDGLVFYMLTSDTSQEFTVTISPDGNLTSTDTTGNFFDNYTAGICTRSNGTFVDTEHFFVLAEGPVKLTNINRPDAENIPTISNFQLSLSEDNTTIKIGGTYTFPANIEEGGYMATIPVIYMYQ